MDSETDCEYRKCHSWDLIVSTLAAGLRQVIRSFSNVYRLHGAVVPLAQSLRLLFTGSVFVWVHCCRSCCEPKQSRGLRCTFTGQFFDSVIKGVLSATENVWHMSPTTANAFCCVMASRRFAMEDSSHRPFLHRPRLAYQARWESYPKVFVTVKTRF